MIFLHISEMFMVIAVVGIMLVIWASNHFSNKRIEKTFQIEMQRREAEFELQRKMFEKQLEEARSIEEQRRRNDDDRQLFRFWEILIMLFVALLGLFLGLK